MSERTPIRRWRVELLCALALLFACGGIAVADHQAAPASPRTLTLPAYLEEIDHWSAELTHAKSHSQDLVELRRRVPSEWTVAAGPEPIRVSTDWLRSGLEDAKKDPKSSADSVDYLLAHLAALRREALALANDRPVADGSAPGKLQGILARREFRHLETPNWLDRKVQQFMQWLRDFLIKLVDRLSGHERVQNAARMVPWILLVAAGGFLLVWMTLRLLKRTPRRTLKLQIQQTAPIQSCQQIRLSAREAAAQGDYREAIRLAYLAAVHRLEDMKFWKVDPTLTHREYLRMVRREQTEYEPLAVLTRHFELAWYGSHPVTQGDFDSVLTQLERLGCA